MRVLVQRVREARVLTDKKIIGQIGRGLLLFVAVTQTDGESETRYLAEKCINLRIFESPQGRINDRNVRDTGGEVLVVSQFTLYGDCRKGRRPDFGKAAPPEQAEELYLRFIEHIRRQGLNVQSGQFQATMQVELTNDGPVTYLLEKE